MPAVLDRPAPRRPGPVDTLAVVAVAAVLSGLYLVRRLARRAVVYDGA